MLPPPLANPNPNPNPNPFLISWPQLRFLLANTVKPLKNIRNKYHKNTFYKLSKKEEKHLVSINAQIYKVWAIRKYGPEICVF